MALQFEMPDEVATGGDFLSTPGKYHCSIVETHEEPKYHGGDKKGQPVDGFRVKLSVLNGPNAGKTTNVTFYNPKMNSRDGGKFSLQKQAAFFIAAGLVDPSKLGQKVEIKLEDAINRQVFVELEGDDEGKYVDLAWANIYHVDDPKAASYPRDEKSLAILPKSMRLNAAVFEAMRKGGGGGSNGSASNGNTNGNGHASKPATKTETKTDVSDDLGDL